MFENNVRIRWEVEVIFYSKYLLGQLKNNKQHNIQTCQLTLKKNCEHNINKFKKN